MKNDPMKKILFYENVELGQYFSAYTDCSPLMISGDDVLYIAATHSVRFRTVLPYLTGYFEIPIPGDIRKLEDVLEYLSHSKDCVLNDTVKLPKTFKGERTLEDIFGIEEEDREPEFGSAVVKDN